MLTKYKSIFVILLLLINTNVQAKQHKQTKHVHHNKVVHHSPKHKMTGVASWYSYQAGNKSHKTASGEVFSPYKHTAAHRSLPFGTKVKVTNLRNDKTVQVIINDRGPYAKGRVIDLSKAAAKAIDMKGIDKVHLKIIS